MTSVGGREQSLRQYKAEMVRSLLAIIAHAPIKSKMGIHVYGGEDVGICVGRRVEDGRKRRINGLTNTQISVDDDAGRVSEELVEVPLPRSSAF